MSASDKARNATQKATGAIKETTGRHTGNRDLEAQGRKDRFAGDIKQAGEKVKDAFRGHHR
jgi:uncharacterized protein YjbJ (UPF0337 family)